MYICSSVTTQCPSRYSAPTILYPADATLAYIKKKNMTRVVHPEVGFTFTDKEKKNNERTEKLTQEMGRKKQARGKNEE